MTTWSPQSTCGVKLGLCLPRRMLAMIVATRPTTRPSASIRCHFLSTSAGLADLVVFISAFMALILSFECERRRKGDAVGGGYLREGAEKSSKSGAFRTGKIIPH